LLLPAVCLIAPAIGASKARRRVGVATILFALVAGQIVLAENMDRKGARPEALRVAAAAQPKKGCLYVYDGYPSLYLLTHSCLPSRWAFPGHLSAQDEGSARALGVDPSAEVRRIMAARPDAVVDDYPRFVFGNKATHAIVQQVLDRDYYLAACVPNGHGRIRLVYRVRDAAGQPGPREWSVPRDCPPTHS
jgi:hypothetical protein